MTWWRGCLAAVAIPVGVAYAQLAGFNTAVGHFTDAVLAALIVKFLNLERVGVKIIGLVPPGLPPLRLTTLLPSLLAEAAGVTLISFSNMLLTGALLPTIVTR